MLSVNWYKLHQNKTKIVREFDYSPASELCSRVRMGNQPKQDLVNDDAHTKLVQITSICSQDIEWKHISDVIEGM